MLEAVAFYIELNVDLVTFVILFGLGQMEAITLKKK